MTNLITWDENSPANEDDVHEGAQRIRESKRAVRERMNRDHIIGGALHTSPTADPVAGADDIDSGFHRRITMLENGASSDQSSTVLARVDSLNGVSPVVARDKKVSEIWLQSYERLAATDQYIMYKGSNNVNKEVTTNTQLQTLTNKTLTDPVVNAPVVVGGTVNDTVIGGVTPAAVTITDLTINDDTIVGSSVTDTVTLNATVQGDSGTGAGEMYAGISGEIKMYAGVAAPTGWLFCHGQEIVRLEYTTLFSTIGTTYGSTHVSNFLVPDFRGRSPLGVNKEGVGEGENGSYTERDRAISGGSEEVTLTGAQSGTSIHTHAITDDGHDHTYRKLAKSDRSSGGTHSLNIDEAAQTTTDVTGIVINNAVAAAASAAHNNESPFLTVNFIIKT